MIIFIIIGAIFLLIILFALFSAKKTVTGTCPVCNKTTGLLKGVGCCEHCGEPLRKAGDRFIPVEAGYIPDNPAFITNLSKLKKPWNWEPTWQGRCVVCGHNATKIKTIHIKSIRGQYGSALAPENETKTTPFEIGYCQAHSDGLRFWYPPGMYAKKNSQCLLVFRSVDFYRHFMQQNALKERQS